MKMVVALQAEKTNDDGTDGVFADHDGVELHKNLCEPADQFGVLLLQIVPHLS